MLSTPIYVTIPFRYMPLGRTNKVLNLFRQNKEVLKKTYSFTVRIIFSKCFYLFCEKGVLEISQNSHENTCARVPSFNKVAVLKPVNLLRKRLWHRCFPVNVANFLRTPFVTEQLRWLLLGRRRVNPK